jgi:exodeoxyribonuclease VIII
MSDIEPGKVDRLERAKQGLAMSRVHVPGMTDEQYFADTRFVSNSMLSKLNESPLHLQYYLDGITNNEERYNIYGRALHCRVLEPNEYDNRFFVIRKSELPMPDNMVTKKENKEYIQEKKYENQGKDLVKEEDYINILRVSEAIEQCPEIRQLINGCVAEQVFQTEINGIPVKCKTDAISAPDYIVDLKSTHESANPDIFRKHFWRYDYDRQGAFYKDITGVERVFIIAVEKQAPFSVGLFEVSRESLETGREKYLGLLEQYRHHFIDNKYGGIENFYFKGEL